MPGGARLRAQAAAFLVAAALLAGACGGATPAATDGSAVVDPTPAPGNADTGAEAALEQAARDSFTAFLGGDDQAFFDLLSRECRESLGFAAVESYLIGRRTRAERVGGIDLSQVAIADLLISDFTGSDAEVRLELSGTSEPFRESEMHTWIFEEGGWRLDDCSDIRLSPNDLEGQGTDRNDPLGLGAVAEIGGWFVSLSHVDQDFEAVMSPGEVEPAAEGHRLVSAQFLVGYNGAEPSVVIGEHLSFAIVSASNVYGDEVACQSNLPGLLYDPLMEATPGEDLPRPLVCREIPISDLAGLLARVTHTPTGTDYWFDLAEQ